MLRELRRFGSAAFLGRLTLWPLMNPPREATPKPRLEKVDLNSWRWLCAKYFAECADYKRLNSRTRYVRRSISESTFEEPIAPGSPKLFRDMPLSKMTVDAVEVLRDRKLEFPEAANSRVKAIRQVYKFGVRKKFVPFRSRSRRALHPDGLNWLSHLDH